MRHLTQEQGYKIEFYLREEFSKAEIARRLGRAEKTINQEIERNCDKREGVYKVELVQRKYEQRNKDKRIRFTDEVKRNIIDLLSKDYCSEQITSVLRKENNEWVSHERIYQFILGDKKSKGILYKHLRCQGKGYYL